MTAEELLQAAVIDARAAYAVYESMPTHELLRVQLAHQGDQAAATTPEGIAFGGGRLALIAAVLKTRASQGQGETVDRVAGLPRRPRW